MRKNMNADKLLKIAKLLDEKNHFALADKFDKIAQNAQTDIYDFNNNPNVGETWYNRLGRLFSGNATIYDYPGLANTLRQNDKAMQFWKNQRQNRSRKRNQYQQPQPQQQDPLLVSTTPYQFVKNLFEFGKKNGLSNLQQTMELYANQGGTLNGQPINQNPDALKLYEKLKFHPGNLSESQVAVMITQG
jgi:hypothetical protein